MLTPLLDCGHGAPAAALLTEVGLPEGGRPVGGYGELDSLLLHLGRMLNISVPQFPYLENGDHNFYFAWLLTKLRATIYA